MEILDPATGEILPQDAIQRVLFIANAVHVYNIPPLASTKGHTAATWTTDPQRHIFTGRLRLVETAYETTTEEGGEGGEDDNDATKEGGSGKLKVDVVLEDPSTGQLFAAAPYTSAANVEPVLDSSRFFALTVRDPSGRKAVLGIGFEERSEAFDLSIALQESRKSLGWEGEQKKNSSGAAKEEEKRDYSLKEGETITVNFGGNSNIGRRRQQQQQQQQQSGGGSDLQSFALAPPPPGPGATGGAGFGSFTLPPPPPSGSSGGHRRAPSAKDLGFDDGQFGEFA